MDSERFKKMRAELSPADEAVNSLRKKILEEQSDPKKNKNIYKTIVAVAACAAVIIAVAVAAPPLFSADQPYVEQIPSDKAEAGNQLTVPAFSTPPETSGVVQNSESPADVTNTVPATQNELAYIKPWNQKTVTERFPGIVIDSAEFNHRGNYTLDKSVCERKYCDAQAEGYDIYEDKTYSISCEVYTLKNISPGVAYAVVFEGEPGCFVYLSSAYRPETLGQLLEDTNLKSNGSFGSICIGYKVYELTDKTVVWDLLLSNASAVNEGEAGYTNARADISTSDSVLGISNLSFALNEDGYIQTNITGYAASFYIGVQKVNDFVNYVETNGRVICEYGFNEVEEQTSNDLASYDEPVMVEQTTYGYTPPATAANTATAMYSGGETVSGAYSPELAY